MLPDDEEPIAFTPLGYPNDQPSDIVRKPIEGLIKKQKSIEKEKEVKIGQLYCLASGLPILE